MSIGLGNIGIDIINEGVDDIIYGFECLIGNKQFTWQDLANKKMAFVIKIATSYTLKWIFKGFKSPFKKINTTNGPKDYFNIIKSTRPNILEKVNFLE